MRGSYRPPSSMEMESHNGWTSGGKLLPNERDDSTQKLKNWRMNELQSTAWWEHKKQWKSPSAREEDGRLAINPVTGKLEDIATAKTNVEYGTKIMESETSGKLSS